MNLIYKNYLLGLIFFKKTYKKEEICVNRGYQRTFKRNTRNIFITNLDLKNQKRYEKFEFLDSNFLKKI